MCLADTAQLSAAAAFEFAVQLSNALLMRAPGGGGTDGALGNIVRRWRVNTVGIPSENPMAPACAAVCAVFTFVHNCIRVDTSRQ